MTGTLTIPLPTTCTAWYLVRVGMTPDQARDLALQAVDDYAAGFMRRRVRELADAGAVRFGPVTGACALAMTGEQRELIRDERWVSIQVQAPTGLAPVHEWAGRTLAGLLASEVDAQVADMMTASLHSEDEMLASLHAKENGLTRKADWVRVVCSWTAGRGLVITTRGMRRYGLPELQAAGVEPSLEDQWCALLTGVAYRLHEEVAYAVPRDPSAAPYPPPLMPAEVRIPDAIGVTDMDVADAYCLPRSDSQSRRYGWRWTGPDHPGPFFSLAFSGVPGSDLIVAPPAQPEPPAQPKRSARRYYVPPECAAGECIDLWPSLAAAGPIVTYQQKIYQHDVYGELLGDPDLLDYAGQP